MIQKGDVPSHSWDLSPAEAIALQKELQEQVVIKPLEKDIQYIGGADISYNKFSDIIYAGIVVLDYERMEVVAYSLVQDKMRFPYIPGLLSFREIPSLIKAWEQLPLQPVVTALDGHGIAHFRRIGVATHFGLLTRSPTIGIAKKILTGRFEEPELEKGSFSPIEKDGETIGYALRTKNKVKPVFVSPGHLSAMAQSREIALHCSRGYRIPEPTRQAHLLVNRFRRGEVEEGVYHR